MADSHAAARRILITGAPRALSFALAERLAELSRAIAIMGVHPPKAHLARGVNGTYTRFIQWDEVTGGTTNDHDRKELAVITDLVHMDAVVNEPRFSAASGTGVVRANIVAAISLLKALPGLKRMYYIRGVGSEDDAGMPRTLCGLTQVTVENFFRLHARRTGISLLVFRLAGAMDVEFTEMDVDAVANALSVNGHRDSR